MDMKAIFAGVMLVSMRSVEALQACCTPDQMTTEMSQQIGTNQGGKGGVTSMFGRLTYDYTGSREALLVYVMNTVPGGPDQNWHNIYDYKKKMIYHIDLKTSTCEKSKLQGDMPRMCIPKTAKYSTTVILGAASDTLKADSWALDNEGHVIITVTRSQCIPVSEQGFGSDPGDSVGYVTNVAFFNTTLNIRDPSVFDIPAICNNADLLWTPYLNDHPKVKVKSHVFTRFGL